MGARCGGEIAGWRRVKSVGARQLNLGQQTRTANTMKIFQISIPKPILVRAETEEDAKRIVFNFDAITYAKPCVCVMHKSEAECPVRMEIERLHEIMRDHGIIVYEDVNFLKELKTRIESVV